MLKVAKEQLNKEHGHPTKKAAQVGHEKGAMDGGQHRDHKEDASTEKNHEPHYHEADQTGVHHHHHHHKEEK